MKPTHDWWQPTRTIPKPQDKEPHQATAEAMRLAGVMKGWEWDELNMVIKKFYRLFTKPQDLDEGNTLLGHARRTKNVRRSRIVKIAKGHPQWRTGDPALRADLLLNARDALSYADENRAYEILRAQSTGPWYKLNKKTQDEYLRTSATELDMEWINDEASR